MTKWSLNIIEVVSEYMGRFREGALGAEDIKVLCLNCFTRILYWMAATMYPITPVIACSKILPVKHQLKKWNSTPLY